MNFSEKIDFAILGAVEVEIAPFFELLPVHGVFDFRGETFREGRYAGHSILLGTTGIGKVNAAITTAALLEHLSIGEVFNIGCAGAYTEGPLRIGDVLVTRSALCGDEGILTVEGVCPSETIGFPLVVKDREKFFDAFPLDRSQRFLKTLGHMPPGMYRPAEETPPTEFFRLVYGPSLTVGMVSGDTEVARRRFSRYEAFAENMEGSAIAQTCLRFEVPMMECRGISNMAGDRDKKHWQLKKAILHCRSIVQGWLRMEQTPDTTLIQ